MSSSRFLDLYGSTAGAPEVPGPVVFVPGLDILAGEVDMERCRGSIWEVEGGLVVVRSLMVVGALDIGVRV